MDSRFKKKESLANVSSIYREYKLKERVFERKVKELEDKLQTEIVVHTETRDFFTRKILTIQDDMSSWEVRYEKEVGLKDDEIKNITLKRKKLLERLSILQNRKKLEILSDAEEKAKKLADAEEQKKEKDLLKRQNNAARVIVREMRDYLRYKKENDALKGKGKSKSKKDKKSGKEKKGKKK